MATLARPRALNPAAALVLMLGASVLLNYVDRGAIGVAAPLMKSDLGLSATSFGLAVSAFFWVYAPVQLVLGRLCDRLSVYRLLAFGTVLWSASTLLMGFVGGFLSLLLLRVMLGVGESIVFPAGSKIICRHVPPENRGLANSVIATALALGPAVGTLVGGSILAALGWRPMFFVFGIASATWLIPWRAIVRGLPETHRAAETVTAAARHRRPVVPMVDGHRPCPVELQFLFPARVPAALSGPATRVDDPQMTMLATLGYGVQAVAALSFGAISDRWTRSGRPEAVIRRWMLTLSQFAAAACIMGIFAAHDLVTVAVLLCIAGAATGALSLNIYAVAQMFAGPRASGTWVGIQNAVGNISGIVGPIISGVIIDRSGFGGAFALTAAIAAIGGFWWMIAVPPSARSTSIDRRPAAVYRRRHADRKPAPGRASDRRPDYRLAPRHSCRARAGLETPKTIAKVRRNSPICRSNGAKARRAAARWRC